MDPDLNHGVPFFRMHPHFRFRIIYKFQLLLLSVIWSIASFWLATFYDYLGVLTGKYHGVMFYQEMNWPKFLRHIFGRFISFYSLFGIPYHFFGFTKWQAFLMGSSFNVIFSVCFMACTQINHFCSDLMIHREQSDVNPCWSIHQVKTAQDFARDSLFWWLFSGGLNFQIEHHLFPGVNHEHLPKIQPIIERLCKKHKVPYIYEPTYYDVLSKYLNLVRDLSKEYCVGSYERESLLKRQEKGDTESHSNNGSDLANHMHDVCASVETCRNHSRPNYTSD